MNDHPKTTCSMCRRPVVRIHTGYIGTRKTYVDEVGEVWMGKKCPPCSRVYNKVRMKRTRRNSKESAE